MISSRATFATRLEVANGVVISKLCYLIQLWGGAEAYLLKSLQVLQNRAARAVTGCSCFTSTKTLLQKCNWLSVQQLIFYQSVILAHKIVTTGSPYYLAQKMSTSHPYRTRQGSTGSIRFGENFSYKSTLAQNSFCYQATIKYNGIPAEIRASTSLPQFKSKLKKWVSNNIPID